MAPSSVIGLVVGIAFVLAIAFMCFKTNGLSPYKLLLPEWEKCSYQPCKINFANQLREVLESWKVEKTSD
jgi:hypothetical protein